MIYTTLNIPRSIMFGPLHFMLYRGKLISFGAVYTLYSSLTIIQKIIFKESANYGLKD